MVGALLCYQKAAKLLDMMELHQPPHTKVECAQVQHNKHMDTYTCVVCCQVWI